MKTKLSSRQQEIIKLREVERLTFKQIGLKQNCGAARARDIYKTACTLRDLPDHWSDGLSTRLANTLCNYGVKSFGDACVFFYEQNDLQPAKHARNYGPTAKKELAKFLNLPLPPKRIAKKNFMHCPHCGHFLHA